MTHANENRQLLVDELINNHGLDEYEIYLIDLFPLIEMIWTDGEAQQCETTLATKFCLNRIAELNNQSEGESPLSIEQANTFLDKYLSNKPDPELLKTIRSYIKPIHLSHSEPETNNERRQQILDYCIDIAAAAVHKYPYDMHDRFIKDEKKLLKEIIDSLYCN
ncbi:MAG: hypothetical protein GY694_13185 [Gammaproteobacteria bacterium]|nr:hypothetical protein [Gammaproteobacteria bacterium]